MLIMDKTEIGLKLYELRKSLHLTQIEVAVQADISERTYADIERGNSYMRTDTLVKLCRVFKITPNALLVKDDDTKEISMNELVHTLNSCSPDTRNVILKTAALLLDLWPNYLQ